MDFNAIKKIFQTVPNAKVALFLRHAERESVIKALLTKKGIEASTAFGKELKSLNVPVKIYSSPELRCVQTAELINREVSSMESEIILTSKLGKPGLQIRDNEKFQKLYESFNLVYKDIYKEWKAGKYYDILRNPNELKEMSEVFINAKTEQNGVTLFVSQSGTIANISYALKIADYDTDKAEWVDFLDGFFIQL